MLEEPNDISRAQTSIICGVVSILLFVLVIIMVSSGFIPIYEDIPNVAIDICLSVIVLVALLGVAMGISALLRSGQSEGPRRERRQAIVGISLSLLLSIPPMLVLMSEYGANPPKEKSMRELATLEVLRTIHSAQADFIKIKGRFGMLKELADLGLIGKAFATGKPVMGYIYSETDISSDTYCVHADRESGSSGRRDYNITESGEIRYIESKTKGTVPRNAGSLLHTAPE